MSEQLIYSVQKQLIELTNIKFSKKYIETYICPIFEYIISSKKKKFLNQIIMGLLPLGRRSKHKIFLILIVITYL